MVICSYKVTAKLSNVSTSEVQVNLVFNRGFSNPNYRVFQQHLPTADPYRMKVGDNFRPQADTQLENQINRY